MINYSYLTNPDILVYIDELQFKTIFARITILDNQDYPLKSIEGFATDGSININGTSAARRTGSLEVVTKHYENFDRENTNLEIMNEITNINTLLAMNKRVQIVIGIENSETKYKDYDIFWFPLGVYIINDASVVYDQNGIKISLTLMDKIALLNGDAGGVIDTQIDMSTEYNTFYIYDIIKALLETWGGLKETEYIIDDIPLTIKNACSWKGTKTLKITEDISFQPNQSIGYKMTEFKWPAQETLIINPGETVVNALDKIKNVLFSNYEYFFDIDGIFHFQKIKNYENEGSSLSDLSEAINEKYFINTYRNMSAYSFLNSKIISAYSHKPQFTQIKNDYTIWGQLPESKTDIRYHLIIASVPTDLELNYWSLIYSVEDNPKIIWAKSYSTLQELNTEIIHYLQVEEFNRQQQYAIVGIEQVNKLADNKWQIILNNAGIARHDKDPLDWRLKLYLQAIEKMEQERLAFDKELIAYIPTMYDFEIDQNGIFKGIMKTDVKYNLTSENFIYFLDALNTADGAFMDKVPITQFGIETIGKRTKVVTDDNISCLFEQSPFMYWVKEGIETKIENNILYLSAEDFKNVVDIAVTKKSAYETLRSELHKSLSYNSNITLSTLPIYHLDVNQRITVNNNESDIHGDFIIQSINIPLNLNGTMTINARKAIEKI